MSKVKNNSYNRLLCLVSCSLYLEAVSSSVLAGFHVIKRHVKYSIHCCSNIAPRGYKLACFSNSLSDKKERVKADVSIFNSR